MASSRLYLSLSFFVFSFLFMNHLPVRCDDVGEEDILFQAMNKYRRYINLTTLVKNDNAECLADEITDQIKNQPCTNTTGSNTVPGTEPQFSDYPALLAKCHLNVTTTTDGVVIPACMSHLDPSRVLTNLTKFTASLNDTKFTGVGIGSEGNWLVIVLTTNTSEGSYGSDISGASTAMIGLVSCLFLLTSAFFIL